MYKDECGIVWYDKYHIKSKKEGECLICKKKTDRLAVLEEAYFCSEECEDEWNEYLKSLDFTHEE